MIQVQAQIRGVSTTVDGGVSIRISTQELTPEDKLLILKLNQAFGWFVFKESKIKEFEIPQTDVEAGQKTKSQRLRGVLFRIWEKNEKIKEKYKEFDDFYNYEMEKVINFYKNKIN